MVRRGKERPGRRGSGRDPVTPDPPTPPDASHALLRPAPDPPHGADAGRRAAGQLRDHPGGARRTGRPGDRPAPGHRPGRRSRAARRRGGRDHGDRAHGHRRHRPGADRGARAAVRLRQAGARPLLHHAARLPALRPGRELLPGRAGDRPRPGSASGIDVAGALDAADRLLRVDSARHPQGDGRRFPVRCLDERRDPGRLRDSRLHPRGVAHRAVRARRDDRVLPAARPGVRGLWRSGSLGPGEGLLLAPGAADHGPRGGQLRDAHDADEELVPRRDPQAVRADGQGEGPADTPRALRPRVPQRDADHHRRLSAGAGRGALHRRPARRDHLLARWPGAPRLRGDRHPGLPDHLRGRCTSRRCWRWCCSS